MAFYNNAFKKVMLANGTTVSGTTTNFLVTAAGKRLDEIAALGPGYIAIINPSTYLSVSPSSYTGDFIVANTSLFSQDKYGSHGGYKMCDLSKLVRPSYSEFAYYVPTQNAFPFVLGVGANSINSSNTGCTPVFYCDQSYIFRVEVRGSAALRTYSRNMYRWIEVKTPCCTGGTVVQVDPTWVFIQIAEGILNDPFLSQFVVPVVYSNGADGSTGVNYIAPSSFNATYDTNVVTATNTWDFYTLGTGVLPEDVEAGIVLIGAYSDTSFTNCSFLPSDYEEYKPIKINADFIDMTGNPCESMTYCNNVLSTGHTGNGYSLTLQKDLLVSQAYLQNYLSDDPRIREANGGTGMLIDRTVKYYRYGFIHTIPRFLGGGSNANLGVFNTDRYVIEIATPLAQSTGNGAALLNTFLTNNFTTYDVTSGVSHVTTITIA